MRAAGLTALLGLAACSEATLDVRLVIPEAFVDEVATAQLRLLRPPTGASFGCEAVAFGEVGESTLRLSLDRQLGVGPGEEAPLVDVDRFAPKLFLADGFGADGALLVRGCLEVGEVLDDAPRRVVTAPVPVLELSSPSTVAVDLGSGAPVRIAGRVVDRRGRPLAGVAVRWRQVSSGAEPREGEGTSRPDGALGLNVDAPGRPGPFVVELRARWAEGGFGAISGLVRPPPEAAVLSGQAVAYRVGRVGPSGEAGFAALLDAGAQVSRVARVYRDAAGTLVEATSDPIRGEGAVLGLIERPGELADQPLVLTRDGWWTVAPTGEVTEAPDYRAPTLPNSAPRRVLAFNSCGGGEPEMIVIYGAGLAVVHDAEGRRVTSFQQPIDVVTAGCVDNELGASARLMVVAQPNLRSQLIVEVNPSLYWIRSWLALPDGISLSPSVGGGPRLLIGSQLDLNDVVVSRAAVRADDQRFELVTRASDRPPEVPLFTRGGDLDGDGQLDLVSLVQRFRPEGDGPFALWQVFGATHAGRRLSGDADLVGGPGAAGFVDPALLLVDLDGDGRDDVVVGERTAGAGRPSQIVIYSMGSSRP